MSRLELATAACFVLGAGLLFPFDRRSRSRPAWCCCSRSWCAACSRSASPERLAGDGEER